jgi:hypothetical protein
MELVVLALHLAPHRRMGATRDGFTDPRQRLRGRACLLLLDVAGQMGAVVFEGVLARLHQDVAVELQDVDGVPSALVWPGVLGGGSDEAEGLA